MSILILNRVSADKIPYHKLLKDYQGSLIMLCDKRKTNGFAREDYDYFETIDNYDDSMYLEYRALELNKIYNFKYIVATTEYDLIRAARLREKLNLPGQNLKSAFAFRDKCIMKDIIGKVLKVPEYRRINNVLDVYEFIEEHGFPVVIKPVDGAGSLNTFIIRNLEELKNLLINGHLEGFEIEEFIKGDMYTIDGFYLDHQLLISWSGYYTNDCLSFKEGKQASNVQIGTKHPLNNRFKAFIQKIVDVMPMPRTTPFHCEVFHTEDDELILCEIASRTGGGGTNELSRVYSKIDLNHAWVKSQCGLLNKDNFNYKLDNQKIYGYVQIPPLKGTLRYLPEKNSIPFTWVEDYKVVAKSGMRFNSPSKSSHKIAIAVVSGTKQEETEKRMELITNWVAENTIWEE